MKASIARGPVDAGDDRASTFAPTNRAVVLLVSLILFAPTALFGLSLRPPIAALTLAGCIGAVAIAASRRQDADPVFLDAPVDGRLLALMIAVSAAVLLFGGELHLVYAPSDWRTRDAVLADISRDWFPLLYEHRGTDYLLRAPLGMYMLPALAGRLAGLVSAHVVLWLQNSLILGAVLYVFARIGRGWPHALVMLAFAGCAFLGVFMYWLLSDRTMLQHMFSFGIDAWNPYFQYSGSLVQLFWAPNHALPAWWLAALVVLQARREVDLATVAATIGGALFWSPLAVLPAFAWVVFCAIRDIRRTAGSRRSWAAALVAPCFVPVAIYTILGADTISHALAIGKPMFAFIYLVFLLAQLVPAFYLLAYPQALPNSLRAPLVFSVLTLVVLPMYDFGPSNDLVMRGSITALVILAFAFGEVLLAPENRDGRPFRVGLVILAICLPSAVFELARPLIRARYAISDCSLFEANAAMGVTGISQNYVVDRASVPHWLVDLDKAPRRVAAARPCWSDGGEPERSPEDH